MKSKNSIIERLTAVILVADKDFGRCAVASKLPRALWPIGEKTVLQRLVDHLADEGISNVVICSALDSSILQDSLDKPEGVDVRFHKELYPRGTAGSIFDAWHIADAELLLVFHAEMISPPKIEAILSAHKQSQAEMTVVFNPADEEDTLPCETAQIYVCEKSVIEDIPPEGYCDIKETLVPKLVQSSRTIYAAEMPSGAGNFRNWQQYLAAVTAHIKSNDINSIDKTVKIEQGAQIIGSVIVCKNVRIGANTLIIGPAVIGRDVIIEADSVISESVIWERSHIRKNCLIQRSLLKQSSYVGTSNEISNTLLTRKADAAYRLAVGIHSAAIKIRHNMGAPMDRLKEMIAVSARYTSGKNRLNTSYIKWITGLLIFISFVWSYYSSVFKDLWSIWMQSDEYSSGLLVPLITAYIIWTRRQQIAACKVTPSLWGIVLFFSAQAFRFFGLFFMYDSAERISMLLTLSSLIVLLFGWKMLGKLTTVLLFLALMIPLPNSIHQYLTVPLQNWATTSAVYCLETIGFSVVREGNIINLDGVTVAVAEACNGLRMITSFFVISSMVALLVKRDLLQKLIIVLSSVPVALLCNTIRLTVTSVAFTYIDSATWEGVFHDFGGLAMMPIALAIIVFELWLLSNIFISTETVPKQVITRK